MVSTCQTGKTIRRLAKAYLTTQQLYPALDSLWRLRFFYVLQGLVEQHVTGWGIRLADHLGKQKGTLNWAGCAHLSHSQLDSHPV